MLARQLFQDVSQLIGPNLRTNGNKLNLKYSSFGSPVEWHQDWAFYPHTNDDVLAVGMLLDIFSAIVILTPLLIPVAAAFLPRHRTMPFFYK